MPSKARERLSSHRFDRMLMKLATDVRIFHRNPNLGV